MVPARPFLIGKSRLDAVERLDLGLLIDREHQAMCRRVEVQADHVFELFGEGRISRQHETAHPMRCQACLLPDLGHLGRRDAARLGHRAYRPMDRLARRWLV
jgi:hypothetical protein